MKRQSFWVAVKSKSFQVHKAIGQYWAELAREFTDSVVLPLNITDLANALVKIYMPELRRTMEDIKHHAEMIKEAKFQLSHLIVRCQARF